MSRAADRGMFPALNSVLISGRVPWPEFARLDLARVKARLANPIIFDGRNLFSCEDMVKEGFTYICIGRPATEDCGEQLQLARRAS